MNALRISIGLPALSGGIILGQSQGALSAVPEPGTALLLAMGLVAIAGYHRRQR